MSARRLRFGLATVLGLAKRGFFIPYRYADALPQAGARPAYGAIEVLFDAHQADFRALIADLGDYAGAFAAIGPDNPPAPRWNQDWFPRLDAAVAYALVRRRAPAHIVEVGSGHSTRFLARAVADGGLRTRITAIDPAPRAAIDGLDVEIIRKPVHQAGAAPFAALAAGDLLCIDSSHILMPGSDVDWLFIHLLPSLPAGLHLHIHDVFLPDDYPADWDWRGYNEQLGVASLLLSGGYRPLFASHYAATRLAEALAGSAVARLPLDAGAYESSLWLEKTCPAVDSRAVERN